MTKPWVGEERIKFTKVEPNEESKLLKHLYGR